MAYSASRTMLLRIDKSPSYLWNNLASSGESLAWARNESVIVLRGAAWDARSDSSSATLECLTVSKNGAQVTSLAWVTLSRGTHILVATSHEEFVVFSPTGHSILMSIPIKSLSRDILRDRVPAEHFFRGLAMPRGGAGGLDVVLVGTSWGDVLAWRLNSGGDVRTGASSAAAAAAADMQVACILKGAHTAPIVAIAADENFIVTVDDTGIVVQWGMLTSTTSGGGGSTLNPPLVLARHDKGAGAACTGVCIVQGAAICVGYSDGYVRIFAAGAPHIPPTGTPSSSCVTPTSSSGRYLVVETAAHQRAVTGISAHSSMASFATTSDDGTVRVWVLPTLNNSSSSGGGLNVGGSARGISNVSNSPSSSSSSSTNIGSLIASMSAKSPDLQTGIAFFHPPGSIGSILSTSAYDATHLLFFKETT